MDIEPTESRKMQFKLTDLLWLTAYFAVGAWLYSFGIRLGLLVWVGAVLGYEIGRRSDYPAFLLTACGAVFGLALSMAVFFTAMDIKGAKVFMFFDLMTFRILLAVVWLTAIGIFVWLVTRLKKPSGRHAMTDPIKPRGSSFDGAQIRR